MANPIMRRDRSDLPIVGIPCDRRMIGAHSFHAVGDKYARALRDAAEILPLLIPSFDISADPDLDRILATVDGIFLTGSPSNVEPLRYGGASGDMLLDPRRDATALPLITRAVAADLPLFAVCRGMQEMNVAFGGTLDPKIHERPGGFDHREDAAAAIDVQYGPAHPVTLRPGGLLDRTLDCAHFMVNSLHGQGIDRLGDGLEIEAVASDGTIEAIRHSAARFALGVQWHPEWKVLENPIQRRLFEAFGQAMRNN